MNFSTKALLFFCVVYLSGCDSRVSSTVDYASLEREKVKSIEALKIDSTPAKEEMKFCISNKDELIAKANILFNDKKYSEVLSDVSKCLYWLDGDVTLQTLANKSRGKLEEIKLADIPLTNYGERLFVIRGAIAADASLKQKYASELVKLENKEKSQVAAEKRAAAMAKRKEGVHIGMSAEDVLASQWGKPRSVNRTTASYGVHEQWVYGGGYLYFENGKLTTIQN